jgi:hypothetical protein
MNDHPGMASISFPAALLLDRFPNADGYVIRLVPGIVDAAAAAVTALPDEAEVEVEDDDAFGSLVAQSALIGLAILLFLVHFIIARRRRRN